MQGFFPCVGHARYPLTESAFGHIQSFGNFMMRPAVTFQVKSAPPTLFFPIRSVCMLGCHAPTLTMHRRV